jgi:hypothetical protein
MSTYEVTLDSTCSWFYGQSVQSTETAGPAKVKRAPRIEPEATPAVQDGSVDFLAPEEEFGQSDRWELLWALGVKKSLPEAHQRGLLRVLNDVAAADRHGPQAVWMGQPWAIAEADVVVLNGLVEYLPTKKNGQPRTGKTCELYLSLKQQLVDWLEGRSDFDSPFSTKQWKLLRKYGYGLIRKRSLTIKAKMEVNVLAEGGEV